jgi:hypothetical protein
MGTIFFSEKKKLKRLKTSIPAVVREKRKALQRTVLSKTLLISGVGMSKQM